MGVFVIRRRFSSFQALVRFVFPAVFLFVMLSGCVYDGGSSAAASLLPVPGSEQPAENPGLNKEAGRNLPADLPSRAKNTVLIADLLKKEPVSRGVLCLVNRENPVRGDLIPESLESVLDNSGKPLIPAKTLDVKINRAALEAARAMFEDAEKEGLKGLIISSAYRSYALQKYFYDKKVEYYRGNHGPEEAVKLASMIVAPPGASEHQTGLAIDLTTAGLLKTGNHLSQSFAETPEGKWIGQNSWKYGFIVRYPEDKVDLTGIIYEPWHIRYVGIPHAELINKLGYCLEEYLEHIRLKSPILFTSHSGERYQILYYDSSYHWNACAVIPGNFRVWDITPYGRNGYIITLKLN